MNRTTATSFADPADLRGYNRALWDNKTVHDGLLVGDNGLGAWSQSTVSGTGPCVALPRDIVLEATGSTKLPKRLVRVFFGEKSVDCQVRDIAPHGIIDLNPDACKELGLVPPVKVMVDWIWL